MARTHGLASNYRNGCRCPACRTAHNQFTNDAIRRRKQRIAADPSLATHGHASTYNNWGCRCTPCTNAHKVRMSSRHRKGTVR